MAGAGEAPIAAARVAGAPPQAGAGGAAVPAPEAEAAVAVEVSDSTPRPPGACPPLRTLIVLLLAPAASA